MNIDDFKNIEMSPDEKIEAVSNLKKNLEDNFVQMGQLLSEIKRTKLFKFRGFPTFKDFIEQEFNISSSFASKVIGNYELFANELEMDEHSLKHIGLDKLNMIKPLVKDTSYQEQQEWLKKAEELPTSELREEIKEIRQQKKENEKNLKDVFIDQYLENMVTYFNCGKKELNFKLALYFQDEDLNQVKEKIKIKQRQFEETDQLGDMK